MSIPRIGEMTPQDLAIRALDELLKGQIPAPIAEADESGLVDRINKLSAFMAEINGFILPLAKGQLSSLPPKSANFLVSPFKELHSRLCELTWQAQQVARGDFSQRIDFMGEFSEAFNAMVLSLDAKDHELKATIHRLNLLLHTALDAIHVIDFEGNLKFWNSAFLKHLGYSEQEAVGLNVNQWDHQWTPDELRSMTRSLFATPGTFETLHMRKDGTILNVEINAAGVVLDGKEMLFATSRDTTDRHRVEVELREREMTFRTLFELSPDPIALTL